MKNQELPNKKTAPRKMSEELQFVRGILFTIAIVVSAIVVLIVFMNRGFEQADERRFRNSQVEACIRWRMEILSGGASDYGTHLEACVQYVERALDRAEKELRWP